jgi:putative addiction module killer protein
VSGGRSGNAASHDGVAFCHDPGVVPFQDLFKFPENFSNFQIDFRISNFKTFSFVTSGTRQSQKPPIMSLMEYTVRRLKPFNEWFERLQKADRLRVTSRVVRVAAGNFGDHKQISENLFELRFTFGGGFRVYYTIRGPYVVFLLVGGDKSSQVADIRRATSMLDEDIFEEEP